mgnify:CR=1 FL=1
MVAFQPNGFQVGGFQTTTPTGGAPPAAVVPLRMLMGIGLLLALLLWIERTRV